MQKLKANPGRLELWRISEAMDYAKTPNEIAEDPSWDLPTIQEFWAFQKIREKEIEKEMDN